MSAEVFNPDDPMWPQNYDEIVAFLGIVDDLEECEFWGVWERTRDEMRGGEEPEVGRG